MTHLPFLEAAKLDYELTVAAESPEVYPCKFCVSSPVFNEDDMCEFCQDNLITCGCGNSKEPIQSICNECTELVRTNGVDSLKRKSAHYGK